MQAFKRHTAATVNWSARQCGTRLFVCDGFGKFVYGANGTITERARQLDASFTALFVAGFSRRTGDKRTAIRCRQNAYLHRKQGERGFGGSRLP